MPTPCGHREPVRHVSYRAAGGLLWHQEVRHWQGLKAMFWFDDCDGNNDDYDDDNDGR
jgi:hypothetical protein